MRKGNIKLAIASVALNALDATLTQIAGIRGTLVEANPALGYFMGQFWWSFWVVKMGLVVGCTLIFLMLGRHYPRQVRKVFIGLIALMVGVCVVNVVGLL